MKIPAKRLVGRQKIRVCTVRTSGWPMLRKTKSILKLWRRSDLGQSLSFSRGNMDYGRKGKKFRNLTRTYRKQSVRMILRSVQIAIICLTFEFEMFGSLVSGEVNVRRAGEKHKLVNVREEVDGRYLNFSNYLCLTRSLLALEREEQCRSAPTLSCSAIFFVEIHEYFFIKNQQKKWV